ncbi:Toprim domain-containing protein [Alicyclobacillus sacchari]|uniref:Toprim domain-containing protein n=1 Tax=Alicyclobacillus sacchari TaxID=392010 RepID=A0A4R8LA86_9BACL|nr:toprim domain-containing protein [Alicyclobacillus sacchari]TDY38989.1 Toprim domain-containing protein [Alicyclobacillus sacchari]GMA58076.1 hypothetical protein GCM10025858_25790 [Alicyclobacillus sacchari]
MTFPFSRTWVSSVGQGLVRLEQGFMFRVKRIPEAQYREADDDQKKRLLKESFEQLMSEAGINLHENLLCPYHDDQQPSMKYFDDTKTFHCFTRCYEKEVTLKDGRKVYTTHKDAFDIVGDLLDLTSFPERYNILVSWFVENPEQFYWVKKPYRKSSGTKKGSDTPSARKNTSRVLATEDPEVKQYLNARGINDDMIVLFNIGAFEENGTKFATVPCDNGFEARRNIGFQPKVEEDKKGKYLNPKGRTLALFNGKALKLATADMPVIVVESAFDSMIINSMGVLSVALNGLYVTQLVTQCQQINNPDLKLILLFDFDTEGQKALDRAHRQLRNVVKTIPVYQDNVTLAHYLARYKDVGEAYQSEKQELEGNLNFIVQMVNMGIGG